MRSFYNEYIVAFIDTEKISPDGITGIVKQYAGGDILVQFY